MLYVNKKVLHVMLESTLSKDYGNQSKQRNLLLNNLNFLTCINFFALCYQSVRENIKHLSKILDFWRPFLKPYIIILEKVNIFEVNYSLK